MQVSELDGTTHDLPILHTAQHQSRDRRSVRNWACWTKIKSRVGNFAKVIQLSQCWQSPRVGLWQPKLCKTPPVSKQRPLPKHLYSVFFLDVPVPIHWADAYANASACIRRMETCLLIATVPHCFMASSGKLPQIKPVTTGMQQTWAFWLRRVVDVARSESMRLFTHDHV